jgi:lysophospholipase L1-like esterase
MRWLKALVYLPAALLFVLVLTEAGVRAFYAWVQHRTVLFPMLYERVYWADLPPWVRSMSIFTADPEAGLWMKPHVDRTYINLFGPIGNLDEVPAMFTELRPTIPSWAMRRPSWRLTTNSLGMRNEEVTPSKPPSTFRIVVLGDSWTVGVNLPVEQTYPRRLASLLGDGLPAGHVEVINYGAIGATAATGRGLIQRMLALDPDLVVVAYAQNDEAAVVDPKLAVSFDEHALPLRARLALDWSRVLGSLESYNLVEYLRTRTPPTIEATLRRGFARPKRLGDNEDPPACANAHAAQTPFRDTVEAIVSAALARHVDVVLVYNNLPEFLSHCSLAALSEVARAHEVPLVDSSALLAAKGAELRADAEQRRNLVPPTAPEATQSIVTNVVFRVDMAGEPGRPFIMGNLPSLGSAQPNVTPLFDDGTHGDQRAGDGVWSLSVAVVGFPRIAYLYTNGDTPGAWTGLENYQPRVVGVTPGNAGSTLYTPIAEFGRVVLRSDPAHPDAAGAALIAEALARAIRSRPAWSTYLASVGGDSTSAARSPE